MTRPPPVFPLKPAPRPGLFRATPPAIFPPILGLLGLGLAWRLGAGLFGLPGSVAELVLGAAFLLWLFALIAYAAKILRRPGVVAEDLRILPGRAGLSAAVLSVYLAAAVLLPYAPQAARALIWGGFALHLVFVLAFAWAIRQSPPEARGVTPVWHLAFVGAIVAAVPALALGMTGVAMTIAHATLPLAVAIWGISLWQLIRRVPPAPLRPLLAIHIAPASFFGKVAADAGFEGTALTFAGLAVAMLLALLLGIRWVTEAGFTPLWGAFTFPLAALANLLLRLDATLMAGGVLLVAATLVILPIVVVVMRAWAGGGLAARTNAAVA